MKVKVEDDCLTADDVRARNKTVRDRRRIEYAKAKVELGRRPAPLALKPQPQPAPAAPVKMPVVELPVFELPVVELPVETPVPARPPLVPCEELGVPLCAGCRARVQEHFAATPERPRIFLEQVLREVSRVTRVSVDDIRGGRRTANVLIPRQMVMALGRKLAKTSLPEIGRRLGDRDHTTVLHGARKFDELLCIIEQRIGADAPLTAWVHAAWNEILGGYVLRSPPPRSVALAAQVAA
jgi:hypothetical protein